MQTLQSLKNRQCEKGVYTSYKHGGPFPSSTRGFLSTKASLKAPQHPGSGKRNHHLLPHSFLSPCCSACTGLHTAIICQLGEKKSCICASQVISQTTMACHITSNKQLMQHCLFNYKRSSSAYLNLFWTSHLYPNLYI